MITMNFSVRGLFILLLTSLSLNACMLVEPKEPVARDTSHDDPKKIAEIAKLTEAKHQASRTFQGKGAFGTTYRSSWTTYKIYNKRDLTTTALQINVTVAPGQNRLWLETRSLSPEVGVVTRMLVNTSKDMMITGPEGSFRVNRLERMIMWNESEAVAKEWDDKQIADVNEMARALGSTMVPRQPEVSSKVKEAITPAGRFTNCYVTHQDKVWLLIDEEDRCYSSAVPLPYIVEIESEKSSQQLIAFGFGAKPSMIPKHIKVVKDHSMSLSAH